MLIILGCSRSGKSTLEEYIVERTHFKKTISYTTRPIREGEVDGIDYHFVDEEMFNKLESEGFFVETATYSANWKYGLPKNECTNDAIAVLTPKGYRRLLKYIQRNPDLNINLTSIYLKTDKASRLIKLLQRDGDKGYYEAIRRSISDIGMFDGLEDEVDFVLDNREYRYNVEQLYQQLKDKIIKENTD